MAERGRPPTYNVAKEERRALDKKRTGLIVKRLSEGATRHQIEDELVFDWHMNRTNASRLVYTTMQTFAVFDPDWASEVMVAVRMGLSNTMRSINEMYEAAVLSGNTNDQRDALVLRLRCLNQLRDLAPRQMEVAAHIRDEQEARRLLFEVHGIDPDTVLEGE